ncbi:hypothetical protein CDD82_1561 [Ophiocordyceps australis]|uniref:aldehyde dehydrogenase (NAD(+)) n=1 Tax=Ophiocordyceps australis TaxID=1399860 RepID=A0A2C5ZL08_9HYPO|nr:hypothetical protein CDD82_1561 [Ophiocordyceps australis]
MDITIYPGNVINGQFRPTDKTRRSIDPAWGKELYPVPVASKDDLDDAVKHARKAFAAWSKTSFEERSEKVLAFVQAIEDNREQLAKLLTTEQGKPLEKAHVEINMAISWLRGFAKIQLKDEVIEDTQERTISVTHMPLGVCGAIVPWNYPLLLGVVKVGPALLTGNTIILKPSPFTPYCNLKMAELSMSIFPPGVYQTLSGDDNLGPWMTSHADIDMISFTGSIPTGKRVAESCAKTLKRCVLELGGNDAAIICEDVDFAKCMPKLVSLAFMNTGQLCMCTKRIYVHEKIYDEFRDAFVKCTRETMKTGRGFEPGVTLGPLQNAMQFNLVKKMCADVEESGFKVALKGQVSDGSAGYLMEPTVVDNPPEDSAIVVEEPFGPIVPLLKWRDEDDVIARANGLRTGLGASVWSRDMGRAERMGRELKAGCVWVNSHFDLAPNVPFGGHMESGLGVEMGVEGFKSYTNIKSLWVWKQVF